MTNIYFELTEELNSLGTVVALASGQAVVYYRIAMMSKDGDWVVRETAAACRRVLDVMARRGARYRPGSPLDIEWLVGGWSSHFEFADSEGRRVRCDFLSRPPRMSPEDVASLFAEPGHGMLVVELEPLIRMKQTQRAKDYPVIGELARLLPPSRELELTTDPDRILTLAPVEGRASKRVPVRAALTSGSREDVVVELARETDRLQQADRARLSRYRAAGEAYLQQFQANRIGDLEVMEAHERLLELAGRLLPRRPLDEEGTDGAAQRG